MHERDARLCEQSRRERIRIRDLVDDTRHARADQQLRAIHARLMRAVRARIGEADAVQRRLHDGVRFRVRRPHAVTAHELAARFRAVRDVPRRPVVARRQDAMLAYEHRPDARARTRRARGDGARDFHEIFVPARSHRTVFPTYHVNPLNPTRISIRGS